MSVARVPAAVVKVVDVKCPGSGECDRNAWDNLSRLTDRDQVKFVIADRVDYEFARDVVRRHTLETRTVCRCGCRSSCTSICGEPRHGGFEGDAQEVRSQETEGRRKPEGVASFDFRHISERPAPD